METTFIYGLTDSENVIRYVGKSDNPEKRLKQHINSVDRKNRQGKKLTHKDNWIKSENYNVGLVILEECSKEKWDIREMYHISQYDKLTNGNNGGKGGGHVIYTMTYEECKLWVRENLCVKSGNEYIKCDKPDYIPRYPDNVYKDKGWVSWGDFLSTGVIQSNKVDYIKYDEAKDMLSTLKIKNSFEYKELVKAGELQKLPVRPERYYRKRGWISWADFLSNNHIIAYQDRVDYYYNFVYATKVAQKLKFKNISDYHKRARLIDDRLPRNPNTFYSEWDGWSKYLGIEIISDNQKHANYLSYNEAKDYMKNNYPNIKSSTQWKKFRNDNEIPSFLPLNPWHTYKNKGWLGWGDYLGTGNVSNKDKVYLPYDEAEKIIHTYSLKNNKEWREFIKNNKNLGIPSSPDKTYKDKGWVSWYVWLGK